MQNSYDVFISVKSEDLSHARRVQNFLASRGINAFLSETSIRKTGSTEYQKEIDKALEGASHIIVIGSSAENITSPWVESEWRAFINERRAGRKTGNVLTLLIGDVKKSDLPLSLRNFQAIDLNKSGMEELLNYVTSSNPQPESLQPENHSDVKHKQRTGTRRNVRRIVTAGIILLVFATTALIWQADRLGWLASSSTRNIQIKIETFSPSNKEFVYVPAGWFVMGSNVPARKYLADERPSHKVYLDGFWISKCEVTNREFKQFIDATKYSGAAEWRKNLRPGEEDLPARWIHWKDAVEYCRWAGGRLPTEAEWEKAARSVDKRTFPWGNSWDTHETKRCNFADKNTGWDWSDKLADDGFASVSPVGSFPSGASPYGALDMAGNVREWCSDWFEDGYYKKSPLRNPKGPASESMRVTRGGSVGSGRDHLSCSARGVAASEAVDDDLGFRVVRDK